VRSSSDGLPGGHRGWEVPTQLRRGCLSLTFQFH
jgi:hypothetical protein